MVAPTPPALRKPSANAPPAMIGSFERMSVAAPSSSRRVSTASARRSRSSWSSRRSSCSLGSVVAILQRLRRQLRLFDGLGRRRRHTLLHPAVAEHSEDCGDEEEPAGDDEERGPHRQDVREGGCDGRKPEAEAVEGEKPGADEEPDPDAEERQLALELREREGDLE